MNSCTILYSGFRPQGGSVFIAAILGLCAAVLVVPTACAQDELPQLEDMTWPSVEILLKADPFDWIVLKDQTVIVCQPLYPRPGTLQKMAEELAELEQARGSNAAERAEIVERKKRLRLVEVNLPNDNSVDYQLPVTQIERVISFEDMILREADALIDVGEISQAYELLMEVERMAPGWEQANPYFASLLIKEAEINFKAGDTYAAMALLDELAMRDRESPELAEMFGETIRASVQSAVDDENYGQARYFLNRLAKHFPEHPVISDWKQRLLAIVTSVFEKAEQHAQAGLHVEAASAAAVANTIWPVNVLRTGNDPQHVQWPMPGIQRAAYNQYVSRHQTLRVAVRDFSRTDVISPVPLEADERDRELTTVSLFVPSSADELTYFQSGFFDEWDPQDLGREVLFTLKSTRPYWQTHPILSANQIAEALSDQLDPSQSTFNPRLASFVSEFSVRSPSQLQIQFHRVPLSLEALFRFPVMGIPEDQQPAPKDAERQTLSTRFSLVEQDEDHRTYRRMIPEPDGLNDRQYHVADVDEIRFGDRHSEIQAFMRGKVDVLPHLLPWEIDIFKGSGRAFVQQYAIPQNHLIAFNPLSPAVKSAQLRRALSVSVDRENLLKKIILRDPEMKYGRITSAPWHSGSYANSPLVDPPMYDHYLAYILRLAALEQLRIPDKQKFVADAKQKVLQAEGEWDEVVFRRDNAKEIAAAVQHIQLPKLRMLCDPDELATLAAEKIVARWQALGFDVELIPADQKGEKLTADDWDLMYRRVRMMEPLLDLWSVLLSDDQLDVSQLSAYPDWMRQELINLDYASSFADAQKKLFLIHSHMTAQAFLIPLWELDDFVAFQKNISGFEARPLSVYHGVERWLVKP
ncbi:MAG: ABC transporter substrate-binding protein [Fuerstiella sp.]|nr:ABC transporter substrate-binding protein [Fuerstiella sp.]